MTDYAPGILGLLALLTIGVLVVALQIYLLQRDLAPVLSSPIARGLSALGT